MTLAAFEPAPLNEYGFPAVTFTDAARNSGPPAAQAAGLPDKADIVVIGAGYVGLSAALHCARLAQAHARQQRIVVLEAGKIGSGASGKSAGHVDALEARETDVLAHCGSMLGHAILADIGQAPDLVRSLILEFEIDCDLRDGYVTVERDGSQTITRDGKLFGIDSYPYLLGLARAARALGVEIHEDISVTAVNEASGDCRVETSCGPINAGHVIGAGSWAMAHTIPFFASLRQRAIELCATMIVTDPIPRPVLKTIMPGVEEGRFPFCDTSSDVAYGSIDRAGRIIFGAFVSTSVQRKADIERRLFELFPALPALFRSHAGRDISSRILVDAERINLTRCLLPSVGKTGATGRIVFAHGIGGHGIAMGTLVGRIVAEKISSEALGIAVDHAAFDRFAAVPHGWMPPTGMARALVTWLCVKSVRYHDALRRIEAL